MDWPLQSQCAKMFGNPSAPGWGAKNIVTIKPPFRMHMGDIPIMSISVNKIAADSLSRVLKMYWLACGRDPARVAQDGGDVFSGAWVVRSMRGIKAVSMHSYGLAVDFNAPDNPLGKKPGAIKGGFTEESPLVKVFESEGWVWGGRWTGRPDPMHFQAARVG